MTFAITLGSIRRDYAFPLLRCVEAECFSMPTDAGDDVVHEHARGFVRRLQGFEKQSRFGHVFVNEKIAEFSCANE